MNIRIVEKNPAKFKIDNKELTVQRSFIEKTREEVKVLHFMYNLNFYIFIFYSISQFFLYMYIKCGV